jgi:hypothetical protein
LVLERQFFLPSRSRFFFAADLIKSPLDEPLGLRWRVPTVETIKMTSESFGDLVNPPALGESKAGDRTSPAKRIAVGDADLRMIPLGLPMSPSDPAFGHAYRLDRFTSSSLDSTLEFDARRKGTRLYSPVVFVWGKRELWRAADWRSATVTNDRASVGVDQAAAMRFTVDLEPIVLFRSFGGRRRFAFVGCQTRAESMLAAMKPDGFFKELIAVE